MNNIHDHANDLMNIIASSETFFANAIIEKQRQIEAYKEGKAAEIEHVKLLYDNMISNCEIELENMHRWASSLGLRQVVIDTGLDKKSPEDKAAVIVGLGKAA